jgi:hypothetical protein
MLSFGSLSFAAPWLLAALVALPVIWWILRVTPPAPRRLAFPAIAFLLGAERREETPSHTPLWLLILRLLIAALVIIGLAGPVLNAKKSLARSGALLIAIDDGWPAAANWDAIKAAGLALIDDAARANQPVILLRTAPGPAQSLTPTAPARARSQLQAMVPQPWRSDRKAALRALKTALGAQHPALAVWLSDGIGGGDAQGFAEGLAALAPLEILRPDGPALPLAVRPARTTANGLEVDLVRPAADARASGTVSAYGESGKLLGREPFIFSTGGMTATTLFAIPNELRNRILRVEIDGSRSAGAVTLLDDRWRQRAIGLVSGGAIESEQPLLSDLYYVERALQPIADLRKGEIAELLEGQVSMLVLADVGRIRDDAVAVLEPWIEAGGILLRFAGPRVAAQSDELVPVTLRQGGRALGGTLSWEEPQALGGFDETSPFAGLNLPKDVTVRRQVLAEPSIELAGRTWARLADGTPLVTAAARGKGRIVLFHVTANADWSNLPLSGLFVEMLERVVALAETNAGASAGAAPGTATLTPRRALDGFGTLKAPPASAVPVPAAALKTLRPGPQSPPGYYGTADHPLALNTTSAQETLDGLGDLPQNASVKTYSRDPVFHLAPWLLTLALLLALLDGLIALVLMGRLNWPVRQRAAAATLAALMLVFLPTGRSWADDAFLLKGALETHLAYAITGDLSVDEMSRAGLDGLSRALSAKTALEPASPVGLDMEKDELTLFPLIYWPVTAAQKAPSPRAQAKLDRYLKTGGMILFDTRDSDEAAAVPGTATPAGLALRRILTGLDVPPLTQVAQGHVLTRSFYLLNEFPGRFAGGPVWVEAPLLDAGHEDGPQEGAVNDGVSSVIIGGNDWAAAWAVDRYGRPIAALIPGGDRQRELSLRFGINLAMYALTGNYKGDEVHTREILKRLGE